jgi:hypothetical protein
VITTSSAWLLIVACGLAAASASFVRRGARIALLACAVVVAAAGHTDLGRWHGQRPRVHYWDFYHYFVATKYFPEVGYLHLNEAAVVADAEDVPGQADPRALVRSMENYLFEPRGRVVSRADAIRAPFTAERWAGFKADVATFRDIAPAAWAQGAVMEDHGYNGAPLTTVVDGTLPRLLGVPASTWIGPASWWDPVAIAGTAGVVGVLLGAEAALGFLFVFFANAMNDYSVIGGSYLRYPFLCAMTLGVVAWRVGRPGLAGLWWALAVHLRVFPVLFVAGVAVRAALSPDRRAAFVADWPFWRSFLGVAFALFAALALVPTPDGELVWLSFFRKMALHSEHWTPNTVGLRYPFFYSEAANYSAILARRAAGEDVNWMFEAQRTFATWWPAWAAVAASLTALGAWATGRGRSEAAFAFGLVPMLAWMQISHYDWMVLAIVPLCFPSVDRGGARAPVWLALCLGLALVAAGRLIPSGEVDLDLRFCAYSLGLLVTVAGVMSAAKVNPGAREQATSAGEA